MKYLLDASALLAVLRMEPGQERVTELFDESAIGAANLAEVIAKSTESASHYEAIAAEIDQLTLPILSVEAADGKAAGLLRRATKHAGLSLGDRICLAMAKRRELIVLTSDRAFKDVEEAVGVEIELIR